MKCLRGLGLVVMAVLTVGAACAGGEADEAPRAAPSTTRREVTLAERASTSEAQLQEQIDELRMAIEALGLELTRLESTGQTGLESRVSTLESQVGVSSLQRKVLTNLWEQISKLESRIASLDSQTSGYNGYESRLSSLEACVQSMRRNWGTNNRPYC